MKRQSRIFSETNKSLRWAELWAEPCVRWAELRMCSFWAGGISSFPFSTACYAGYQLRDTRVQQTYTSAAVYLIQWRQGYLTLHRDLNTLIK